MQTVRVHISIEPTSACREMYNTDINSSAFCTRLINKFQWSFGRNWLWPLTPLQCIVGHVLYNQMKISNRSIIMIFFFEWSNILIAFKFSHLISEPLQVTDCSAICFLPIKEMLSPAEKYKVVGIEWAVLLYSIWTDIHICLQLSAWWVNDRFLKWMLSLSWLS